MVFRLVALQMHLRNPRLWLQACVSLRKHAYSNLLKILQPKNENFQIKISDIFLYSC